LGQYGSYEIPPRHQGLFSPRIPSALHFFEQYALPFLMQLGCVLNIFPQTLHVRYINPTFVRCFPAHRVEQNSPVNLLSGLSFDSKTVKGFPHSTQNRSTPTRFDSELHFLEQYFPYPFFIILFMARNVFPHCKQVCSCVPDAVFAIPKHFFEQYIPVPYLIR